MDFVAIDFETANGNPNSACQLAAVVVCDSEIVDEHCWLIRPPSGYFSARNVEIHGIRARDVVTAPTMAEVWQTLHGIIDGQILVAHNARFDLGVLIHSLAAYDIACPFLEFTCTRLLARRAWPGRFKYGLKPLGDWLGIEFKHHDALEDARCCANIALRVARTSDCHAMETLEGRLNVSRGYYRNGAIKSPRARGRSVRSQESSGASMQTDRWGFPTSAAKRARKINLPNVLAASDQEKPLEGKHIVMLGPLGGMDIDETLQLLQSLGATCSTTITSEADYVVACGRTLESAAGMIASQLAPADIPATNRPAGIRVLSERQFRALLPAGRDALSW